MKKEDNTAKHMDTSVENVKNPITLRKYVTQSNQVFTISKKRMTNLTQTTTSPFIAKTLNTAVNQLMPSTKEMKTKYLPPCQ